MRQGDLTLNLSSRVAAESVVPAAGSKRRRRIGGGEPSAGAGAEQESGGCVQVQQDAWLQLSRLYGALGERDALVGVSARASRLEETR